MTPLHPKIVHFPIVLLIIAGVFYLLELLRPGRNLGKTGFFLHAAGLLTSIAAILTGDYAESTLVQTKAIHEWVEQHEMLGMMSTWGFGLLGVWVYLRHHANIKAEKIVYVIAFWAVVGVMTVGAHAGGEMVYEHGAGVAPMRPQLEKIKALETENPTSNEKDN